MDKNEYKSVIDYIRKIDQKNDQNSIALEYYDNKITRKQYWSIIDKYRKYFNEIGITKDTPVAICMLNSPEYEFIFSSLLENGSIASTVSKSFLNADFNRQTVDRNIRTLILSIEFLPELIKNRTFDQMDFVNDGLENIIFTTSDDYSGKNEDSNKLRDYKDMIDSLSLPKSVKIVYPGEMKREISKISNGKIKKVNVLNNIATYSNTGGTTGAPKCVCHTHKGIVSLLKSHDRNVYPEFNLKEHSRSLLVIPISHITSQFYALLIRRASGANIIYDPHVFEPGVLKKVLIDKEIDDVVLPFGLYYSITRDGFKKGSLKLNTPLCGGEPTPFVATKDVNDRLTAAGGEKIIIGTGSTEFGSGIMASYGIKDRTNESGYCFPKAHAVLIDPNTGNEITEPGKRGILYANAPWQMEGYLNDDKATDDFFNIKGSNGKIYGTNNDIAEIVGEHNGKPVYSMLGRASDFILETPNKTYYPGANIVDGKVEKVNFDNGSFLFDIRDILLDIDGIMEVQPIILPKDSKSIDGYPVINMTVRPGYNPTDILKSAYQKLNELSKVVPSGIIFRTKFARSLASDKREIISLKKDKRGYYYVDKDNNIYGVEFSDKEKPKMTLCDKIMVLDPPKPENVFSNRKSIK